MTQMNLTARSLSDRSGTVGDAPHPVVPAMIDWESAIDRIKNQTRQELWVFPPLVREAMPESEAGDDLRWMAWHGIDAEGQTDPERQLAARARREMDKEITR